MNNTRKIITKSVTAVLAGTLFFTQCSMPALAAEASAKEEVIYAMLDSDGTVNGVYAVNSFAGGDITDYGNYTDIRNLTTTDELSVDGDTITFHTDADKIYYQGNLADTDIPWNIAITYKMDDKEYTAEEIAGMSGKLKLLISITQNPACNESFYNGYALQASITLDTKKCSNIVAEDATIANVGSDKQLSYIIMPKKGKEIVVTADVKDFEMDAISINGMKLNLNLELDENEINDKVSELQTAVTDLNSGAANLDKGASDLKNGAQSVYDGSVSLSDGASTLNDGVSSLNQGIATMQTALNTLNSKSGELNDGSAKMVTALQTLQSSLTEVSVDTRKLSELSSSSTQIKSGIDQLVSGLQSMDGSISSYYTLLAEQAQITDINALSSGNASLYDYLLNAYAPTDATVASLLPLLQQNQAYISASTQLVSGIDAQLSASAESQTLMAGALSLQANYKNFDDVIQSMVTSLGSLGTNMTKLKTGVDTLLSEYSSLDSGIHNYTDAVAQIVDGYSAIYNGSIDIAKGTSDLYNGTKDMVNGTQELFNGSDSLKSGTSELTKGTKEFYSETQNMDTEISDTIDKTIDELTGKEIETISFVSEKNTNVTSVLFVIKTPTIEKPETEELQQAETQTTGIWEKFKNLF